MRTRLTELLGIEHPVMLAGMGGVSYHRLVTAVSEAGGFGCLGASTMTNDQMVAEITQSAKASAMHVQILGHLPAFGRLATPTREHHCGGSPIHRVPARRRALGGRAPPPRFGE